MHTPRLLRLLIASFGILASFTASAAASTLLYATTSNPTGSSTPSTILRIDEDGNATPWNINWGANPFSLQNPQGLDIDGAGNLYVNDGSSIFKITPSGNGSLFATKPTSANALGLTIDSEGNVYATGNSGTSNVIYRYNSAGLLTATWEGSGTGLTVGPDGRVYAADTAQGLIWRYDSAGTSEAFVTQAGVWDVTFDKYGSLYYTMRNRYVLRKAHNGINDIFYNNSNIAAGAIAFTQDDTLYIGNKMFNDYEIRRFSDVGQDTSFVNLDEEHQVNFMVVVPEPGIASFLLFGAVAVGWRRRRGN